MGRSACCFSKGGLNRGAWSTNEDMILSEYIRTHGEGRWTKLSQNTGLKRCGKSCRLRWRNYFRPDIKRGDISPDEDELIIRMHNLLGNRWSLIAGRLPGRTENEIKNYWITHLSKKLAMKESPRKKQILNIESTFLSPLQNKVFKPTPVKMTTGARHSEMVRPKGCNSYGCNQSSDEAAFKLSDVNETTNPSKSEWCDLLVENSIANDESERIALAMAYVNLVGLEVKNSTCSLSSLADQQSPHSNHFADTSARSLLDFNGLSSPYCNDLLLSPSNYSLPEFGLEEFYVGQPSLAVEIKAIYSFTFPGDPGMKVFNDNTYKMYYSRYVRIREKWKE